MAADQTHPQIDDASSGAGPEQYVDPAHESLTKALHSAFNVLFVIMVALVIAYLLSGVFIVRTGETGLVARLGALRISSGGSTLFAEGYHLAWPDPFDEKIRLSGEDHTIELDTFLFRRADADMGKSLDELFARSESLKPGVDGAMFTGDKNLSHGLWKVRYKIKQGDQFVINVGESHEEGEALLRRLTENTIVRTVAGQPVEALIKRISTVSAAIKAELQTRLDALDAGIEITDVSAQTIWPQQVRQSLDDVETAQADRATLISEAEQRAAQILNASAGAGYRAILNEIDRYGLAQAEGKSEQELQTLRDRIDAELEKAGGFVAVALRRAEAKRNVIRETVQREYELFSSYLPPYKRDPLVTLRRLWTVARNSVIQHEQNEVFFLPSVGNSVEIVINRDERIRRERDAARYRQQAGRP